MDFKTLVTEEKRRRYPWLFIEKVKGKGPGYHKPHRGRPGQVGGSLPRKGRILGKEVGLWFKTEPWTQNKVAIARGDIPGIQYDPKLRASAQHRGKYITVGNAFFREDVDSRRLTLYHEAGHSLAGAAFGKQGEFLDVIEPFRQDKQRPRSVRSTYDNFAGLSSRPEEFLSDVYADLIHGGKARYESQKYRVVYSYVAKLAKQYGLPYQPLYRIKGGKWVRI